MKDRHQDVIEEIIELIYVWAEKHAGKLFLIGLFLMLVATILLQTLVQTPAVE